MCQGIFRETESTIEFRGFFNTVYYVIAKMSKIKS